MTKNIKDMEFNKEYEKGNFTISINSSKTDIKVDDNKITISSNLEGKVIENNAEFILKDTDMYKKLNDEFGSLIEDAIKEFVQNLQKNKSDILGFQDIYYRNTRKDNHNLWQSAEIDVDVNLKINTKGFIFEVKK